MMHRCPTWIDRQTRVSPTHTENSEEEAFSEEVNTSKFARRGKNNEFSLAYPDFYMPLGDLRREGQKPPWYGAHT